MTNDKRDLAAELDLIRERNEGLLIGHKLVLRQAAVELRRLDKEIKDAHSCLMNLGVPSVVDGETLTLAERIGRNDNDQFERMQLWDECFKGHLVHNCGVSEDDIKAAEEWANHVMSK
jgi:hypothetical protein